MTTVLDVETAPIREPGYRPRQLTVTRRETGEIILQNPAPLPPVPKTLLQPLAHWAETAPDRLWLAERQGEDWRRLTYQDGWQSVQAVAQGLLDRGLSKSDGVLSLSANSLAHAQMIMGTMAAGGAICPVTPQYGRHQAGFGKLKSAYDRLQPKWIFLEDGEGYAAALAHLGHPAERTVAVHRPQAGQVAFADLLVTTPTDAVSKATSQIDHDTPAKYLLTSGSTGQPKVVINTHGNLCTNGAQIRAVFADDQPITMVNALPWSHSLGGNAVFHMLITQGGSLYIDHGKPTPEGFGETVRNLKDIAPTYHLAVPAAFALLADALEQDDDLARNFFKDMKILQYGGASLGEDVYRRIQAVAVRHTGERITFAAGYGATETAPTVCNVHWPNDRMGMLGSPVPGTTLKLLPVAGKYELRVKGPQVTPGYVGDPEATKAAFDDEGFYKLGDAVTFVDPDHPDEGLKFAGRLSEDFKLQTGTWVSAGALRVGVVSALDGLARDVIVCGENQADVGVLIYPHYDRLRALCGAHDVIHPAVRQQVIQALQSYNAHKPPAQRVGRVMVLDAAPDAACGEITDKGYLNQAIARDRHGDVIAHLYAPDSPCWRVPAEK